MAQHASQLPMRSLPGLARLSISQRIQIVSQTSKVQAVINSKAARKGNKCRAHRSIKNQLIGGSHVRISGRDECTPTGWQFGNGFAKGENGYLF